MEVKKVKSISLFWMFLRQLLLLSVWIFLEIIIIFFLFDLGFKKGFILPANYAEHYLEKNMERISHSEPFDESLIPHVCKYGLFDKRGKYLSGNFDEATVQSAEKFMADANSVQDRFVTFERTEGYCIVKYDISAHFAVPFLHNIFPKLELSMVILFIIMFLFSIIKIAMNFGKRLNLELNPLLEEMKQIQNRELDISRKKSKVKEFDNILSSLYEIEIALAEALKKEWEAEQTRKANISALAHDIKTPLTIIKGNAELIAEEENIEEIYSLVGKINTNSDKIEHYIRLLIEEANTKECIVKEKAVGLEQLAESIISQSREICKTNQIELIIHKDIENTMIFLNSELVERAVSNIVKNAVEHTKDDKKIQLTLNTTNGSFFIMVEDFGSGFSKEALQNGKKLFFTGKTERSSEHYGIGLYFAESVAEKYSGSLSYWNKENNRGAIVKFLIFQK